MFLKKNLNGSIIIISSIAGLQGVKNLGAYSISKTADIGLIRSLAVELGKHNITVNGLCPGIIKTDFAKELWDNPSLLKEVEKLSIDEIASSRKISYQDVLSELETIVFSGTKLDLTYLVNEIFDEESIDELSEFFHELKSDSLDLVLEEFSEDYETDDLTLFRLYFYSKHAS